MKCPHCGEQIPATAKVCGNCGQALKPSAQRPTPQPGDPVKKKHLPTWLKWAIGVGIVFVFITIFSGILAIRNINRSRAQAQIEVKQTETALMAVLQSASRPTSTVQSAQPQPTIMIEEPPDSTVEIPTSQDEPTEETPTEVTPTEEATPPQSGDEVMNSNDGAAMVYVPAGNFKMGAADYDQQAEANEKPQRTVFLDGFWIYKYEVTNQQYLNCLEKGNCLGQFEQSPNDNYPVVSVTWYEAAAYCELVGGRLPSEAEWEKAARGVALNLYPWGDTTPNCTLANYSGCNAGPAPVGSYPNGASPYGVMDMAGNVWEWVADWFNPDYYSQPGNTDNPLTSGYTGQKGIRGGSWGLGGNELRVSFRGSFYPDDKYNNIGFRCVISNMPE